MGRHYSSFGLVASLDSLRRLEPFWGVLGSSWSVLEVSWIVLGTFFGAGAGTFLGGGAGSLSFSCHGAVRSTGRLGIGNFGRQGNLGIGNFGIGIFCRLPFEMSRIAWQKFAFL